MTEERFYIRFKGRVLGPLPPEKIQEMVRRGQITRQHELSPDGQSWANAETHERFFAKAVTKNVETAKATEREVSVPQSIEWYAHFDGANQGPVDEGTLLSWIASGRVSNNTMLWKDGMAEWLEAGVLRPEWFAKQKGRGVVEERSRNSGDENEDNSIVALAVNAQKSRGWMLFLSITGIVVSSLAIIGSSFLFFGVAYAPPIGVLIVRQDMGGASLLIGNPTSPEFNAVKAWLVITAFLILAGCFASLFLSILLFRVASKMQILIYRPSAIELQAVNRSLSIFWATLGILTLVGIAATIILTFVFMMLGVRMDWMKNPAISVVDSIFYC